MPEVSEGFVTAEDGVRLAFQESGEGRGAVVVPNGWYLLRDLEGLAKGRRLIAYDPRNRGRSDRAEDGGVPQGSVAREVADLEAVRRHFGLERMSLVGHSYVAMILVAYVPWLWFRMMDPKVVAHYKGDMSKANIKPSIRDAVIAKYVSSRA